MRSQWVSSGEGIPLVMVAGWATDYQVFLDIPTDRKVMIIDQYDPFLFPQFLAQLFESEGILTADFIGFSMGGYAVLQFCNAYPQFCGKITLLGVRPVYPASELRFFLKALAKGDVVSLLTGFYQAAMSKLAYDIFEKTLLPEYLLAFSGDDLERGIRYLSEFGNLNLVEKLPASQLRFVHGRDDKIAPIVEIEAFLKEKSIFCEFLCVEGGHIRDYPVPSRKGNFF